MSLSWVENILRIVGLLTKLSEKTNLKMKLNMKGQNLMVGMVWYGLFW